MDDASTITEILHRYYRDFSSLDPDAIAPYFSEPCVFLTQDGINAAATLNDVKEGFKITADGLRARGYTRSELTELQVKNLTGATVFATGISVRYKSERDVLERVGVTYLLQKIEDGWKIVVTVIHDSQAMSR
jgi:ketosteroid isomerase-like protein